jgi:hypothetical protein
MSVEDQEEKIIDCIIITDDDSSSVPESIENLINQ